MAKGKKKSPAKTAKLGQDSPNPLPYGRWPREYEDPYAWTEQVASLATRMKESSTELSIAHTAGNEAQFDQAKAQYRHAKEGLLRIIAASDQPRLDPNIIAAQTLATQTMLAHVLFHLQAVSSETGAAVSIGLAQAADALKAAHDAGIVIAKQAQATVDAYREAFNPAPVGKIAEDQRKGGGRSHV